MTLPTPFNPTHLHLTKPTYVSKGLPESAALFRVGVVRVGVWGRLGVEIDFLLSLNE